MLIYFSTFFATYEKIERLKTPDNILEVIAEMDIEEYYNDSEKPYQYFTKFGDINGTETIVYLSN
jgi:hypothetical protein